MTQMFFTDSAPRYTLAAGVGAVDKTPLSPAALFQFVFLKAKEMAQLVDQGLAHMPAQLHLGARQALQGQPEQGNAVGVKDDAVGVTRDKRHTLVQTQQGAPPLPNLL